MAAATFWAVRRLYTGAPFAEYDAEMRAGRWCSERVVLDHQCLFGVDGSAISLTGLGARA